MNVVKLIKQVKKYSVLYGQTHPKYKNTEYKESIWKIIATTMEVEVEGGVDECKRKWASVRDQFRRTLQKRKRKFGKATRKYKYEEMLSFLIPHQSEMEGQQVGDEETKYEMDVRFVEYDDIEERPDRNKTSSTKEIYVADPLINKNNRVNKERESPMPSSQHPVDAFLGGIAASLKALDPLLLHQAKGRIFGIVQELELKQIQINSDKEDYLSSYHLTSSTTTTTHGHIDNEADVYS